ncbi:MAG: adenosylcobinamide-GDP ribazoletransferase [Pseudomonadota bacterium]|nr:adenosylcobinamide-GDP ribazoletransferase [Pseudomonadota bacterium]
MTASDRGDQNPNPFEDIYRSVIFLTRFPAPDWPDAASRKLATASWAFPLVGVLIATLGGIVYAVCEFLGLPLYISGLLAVTTLIMATGGLHEDGLADVADGVWGGNDKKSRLAIMSDSRIGTFGAIALVISVSGRALAIVTIAHPLFVLGALVASAAISRAVMPVLMAFDDPAKATGLAAQAGKPNSVTCISALLLAVAIVLAAAPAGWFVALLAAATATIIAGCYLSRSIGGFTGDTLGATQQVAELLVLAAIAGAIKPHG